MPNARQLALDALNNIYQKSAYTDIALNRVLNQESINQENIKIADKNLTAELVYGVVRRQRTLDALIDQLGRKKAHQQPPKLRIILHLGLYQLRYLDQIPAAAAVNTAVELAKKNNLGKLAGVINGILRAYLRQASQGKGPLQVPSNFPSNLGVLYSFPDWLVELFAQQFGQQETEKLCAWFNHNPHLDLRVNLRQTSVEELKSALEAMNFEVTTIPYLPQCLRLYKSKGNINKLPGFSQGWFSVQDGSAQLVSHLLDPQPGEVIIDACAAPGGKTTHIAELMADQGEIYACDRHQKRLLKVRENAQRLQLKSIKILLGDSSSLSDLSHKADRVLVDAPCSGLGTLHKRPDIRWRQTIAKIQQLSLLQEKILNNVATWVKPGGILVYATCTLNPQENEQVINLFLRNHPHWQIQKPESEHICASFADKSGSIKVLPHHHQMDGFFMVKLKKEI